MSPLIEDLLRFRNQIHKGKFRFDITADLWAARYLLEEKREEGNIVKIIKNGALEGYAVYMLLAEGNIKAYRITEICASTKETLDQLIDKIIKRGVESGVDFVFLRKIEEPSDEVYKEKKFVSFVDCVIMAVLLNPHELLLSMSENIDQGKILKLLIKGFDPIMIQIKNGKTKVVKQEKSDLVVAVDSKTFLRLFFGRTSFFKEFLKRRLTVSNAFNLFNLLTVIHFFNAIKQERSYIPLGDWT